MIKMINIEINNKQNEVELDECLEDLFKSIARKAGEIEGYNSGEISVALVNNHEIKKLNNKFRQQDKVTDVLSFPMDEDIWGDVIISVERARSQAQDFGHSLNRELCYLLTHSILHLLGYDHKNPGDKKQMRQKEERIMGELNLDED